jgi:hypothetical protein
MNSKTLRISRVRAHAVAGTNLLFERCMMRFPSDRTAQLVPPGTASAGFLFVTNLPVPARTPAVPLKALRDRSACGVLRWPNETRQKLANMQSDAYIGSITDSGS